MRNRPFVFRLSVLALVLALFAAACGGDDDREAATDDDTTETTAGDGGDAGATFGDAAFPCGEAEDGAENTASDTGVTATEIKIGTGDDSGYASAPGLNHEQVDAIRALAERCNELGGINGRKITVNYYDAKLLEVKAAMTAACSAGNFFLVGNGWALDAQQEETRLGCSLPSAPTYTVSASFAMSKDVFQGVPNPADETPSGIAAHLAKLYPEKVKKAATLVANYSATQETRDKVLAAFPEFGWTFTGPNLEYNITGEADWTPFVRQLQSAGAEIVYFSGSCLPNYQKFMQTAKANGFTAPDVVFLTDANFYEQKCVATNTDGALDGTHLRFAFVPFEEASDNKATQDYLDLLEDAGGDTSLLGMQATSSFLLWATAAKACGAELTRACVIENMEKVTEWTGHGLHAETNPGENHPPACNVTLKIEGTKYVRVAPEEAATFDCDPKWITKTPNVKALEPLKLDAERHSHQFDQ